jgi:hypothetical protein
VSAPMRTTPSPQILADRLRVAEGTDPRGIRWAQMVTILPRVRPERQPPPCGFCRETTVRTNYGWACPACNTEERTHVR